MRLREFGRGLVGAVAIGLAFGQAPALASDPAQTPPLHVFMAIQSGMERVAAGHPLPVSFASEPFLALVEAYAAFLADDVPAMDASLAALRQEIDWRMTGQGENAYSDRYDQDYLDYLAELSSRSGQTEPLQRLVVGMRSVGAFLFLDDLHWLKGRPSNRKVRRDSLISPVEEDAWLRLPCRTLAGRVPAFAVLRDNLGELAGPLLSCPAMEQDLARLEALALQPQQFVPSADRPAEDDQAAGEAASSMRETAPSGPWLAEDAAQFMASDPDKAEAALTAAAGDNREVALDLAVFLMAFRDVSPARDAHIRSLTNALLAIEPERPFESAPRPDPFDGSDDSLMEILVYLSVQNIVHSGSVFYAIPCDAVLRHPGLLDATDVRYGSNADNFTPRSGCRWGRGTVSGFPDELVGRYSRLAEIATGDFVRGYGGSMRFGYQAEIVARAERLRSAYPAFLQQDEPPFEFPYQTWGMTGLYNWGLARRIHAAYGAAFEAVVADYRQRGIAEPDALYIAKAGLFELQYGSRCGDGVPQSSLRWQIMTGTPLSAFRDRLLLGEEGEAPEVLACGRTAGLEPLEHVAVVHPQALAFLLDHGGDANRSTDRGKTPLMAAAQYDRIDAARLLLANGAKVDAATWHADDYEALRHDGRTALMYAAAYASWPVIQLLLDQGADPYAADSKGRRAIDYLLGYGPDVAANRKLSASDRQDAIRALY